MYEDITITDSLTIRWILSYFLHSWHLLRSPQLPPLHIPSLTPPLSFTNKVNCQYPSYSGNKLCILPYIMTGVISDSFLHLSVVGSTCLYISLVCTIAAPAACCIIANICLLIVSERSTIDLTAEIASWRNVLYCRVVFPIVFIMGLSFNSRLICV